MATVSSNTCAPPTRDSPIRAGRIRTTRFSTLTADWPKAQIALAEVQGYVYAAKRMAASCARRIRHDAIKQQSSTPKRRRLPRNSKPPSGVRRLRPMRWRSTAPKSRARCARRMPVKLLFTGIADPERAALVAKGLLRPHFFSGWGIRTVAQRRGALQPDVVSQRLDLAA